MKRILAILICVIMVFSLVACTPDGDGSDSTTTTTTTTAAPTTTTTTSGAGADEDRLAYSDWDKDGYHIYVSNSGYDYNDGLTLDTPVQTIYRANEIAREYINSEITDKQDVIISFEEGNYYISSTVNVPSGTQDVGVYYTSRGGRAYLTGGLNIKSDEIKKCTDSSIVNRVFDETARENLYVIDLTNYTDYLTDLLAASAKTDIGYIFDAVEFYAGNVNLKPSRFPEEGYQVSDNTMVDIDMPGAFAITYINYMKNGQFVSVSEIGPDFATTPVNIFLRGETYERVKSWDVDSQKIYIENTLQNNYTVSRHYLTGFTDHRYSFNGNVTFYDGFVTLHTGRSGNGSIGIPSDGGSASEFRRAYFFNIIEEINDPGEYYYDEDGKKLYVYLDETMSLDDLYIATLQSRAINVAGTESNYAQNVHFVNLGFKYSQTDLMCLMYATNVSVTGCFGGLNAGLFMCARYATDITVKDSLFEATGTGTFAFYDCAFGDLNKDGVYDLANILVENCVIRDISEQHVDYRPAFKMERFSGLTVRKCTVSDGGHAAVQYYSSCNLLFEYNEWYDFMTETDDGGLSYSGLQDVTTMTGIVWRYNLIHDIGSSWQPWCVRVFYSDADSMLYTIHDNLIYNFMKGDCNGLVFHNIHGANIYNNIIMNTASQVEIMTEYLYPRNLTWLMQTFREETMSDNWSWTGTEYHLKFGYEEADGTYAARDVLYSSDLLDDDFKYAYQRIKYLRSDEFLYDMFSKGYAHFGAYSSGGSALFESCMNSVVNGGTIAIDENTIMDFSVRLSDSIGGKAKGTYTFNSIYEMSDFLVDVGYRGYDDTSKLPKEVSIYYNDMKLNHFYHNLLAKDSPKEIANWQLSRAALKRQEIDSSISTDIEKLFSQGAGWAHYVYRAAIFSKVAYTGLYTNNLTINVGNDLSTIVKNGNNEVYWDSIFALSTNYADYDGIDIQIMDENGEYTTDFIDTIDDILYNDPNLLFDDNGDPLLKLPDLSKIGARLDVK